MTAYFDATRTYLRWEGSPTGIQRAIYGLCSAGAEFGIKTVVFHPGARRWYAISKHSGLTHSARSSFLLKGVRRVNQILGRFLWPGSDFAKRKMDLLDWDFTKRLRRLKTNGELVEFGPGDSLYLLDLNLSAIPFFATSLEHSKRQNPGLKVVGFVHDIFPLRQPRQCGFLFRKDYEDWMSFLRKNVDRLLTNSEEVAKSLDGYFVGKSVRAVSFGNEVDVLPALRPTPPAWILSVGTLCERKNHGFLLDALEPLWASGQLSAPLIIAGRFGRQTRRLRKRIQASTALRRYVTILGEVSDDRLWQLYRGARLNIVPSTYEGYGLTVTESLQFGCPCFASNIGGIPEAGGNSVRYFDPYNPDTLRGLVLKFFTDEDFESEMRQITRAFEPRPWRETVRDFLTDTQIEVASPPSRKRHEAAIDVVYTWCDETDPEFSSKIARYRETNRKCEGLSKQRFRNRDELKYSLRSLESFVPWFRNVCLVTNGQFPQWLKLDHPRLRLVTHREIFADSNCLPCFNSLAIELNLRRIPGLSENFIYFNDDFFVGRELSVNCFFSSQGNSFFFVDPFPLSAPVNSPRGIVSWVRHEDLMKRCHRYNHRLLKQKLHLLTSPRTASHVPQVYSKSHLSLLDAVWQNEVALTLSSRFRQERNLLVCALYPHLVVDTAPLEQPYYLRTLRNDSPDYFFRTMRDGNYREWEAWFDSVMQIRPSFFCFNDALENEGLARRADLLLRSRLAEYFPRASSFEK